MKTVTLPGKTITLGAKLTPAKAEKQTQSVTLTPPVALVAYGGGDWASNISTSKRIIALAFQWADGVTTKGAKSVAWSLSDPDHLNCTISEAPNSISAALFIDSWGFGTVTVTATVDGQQLTATITTIGE